MAHSRTSSTMEEKHDFGQPRLADRSPNLCRPTVPDHGCVELLWDNGRIVMHGMSNRTNVKAPIPAICPPTSVKAQEKEFRHTTTTLKTRTYRETGSVGNGLQTAVPLEQTRINNQEDEMDPSLDYPIDDFHSEFLTEVPGIDLDSLSPMIPAEKITSCGQVERDIHVLENAGTFRAPAGYSGPGRMRNSKCQTFMSNGRPKDSDPTLMAASDHRPDGDFPITKMQTQRPTSSKWVQPRSSPPLMNFSNFSRLAAMVKSNLQFVDRISSSETACSPPRSNPIGSKLIESANDLSSAPAFHGQMTPVTSKAMMSAPPAQDTVLVQHPDPICREDATRNPSINNGNDVKTKINLRQPSNMSTCHGSSFPSHAVAEGKHGMEKSPKPVAVSPSMCSGNEAGASSNGVKNRAKRKIDEGEETAYQSEDLEDNWARIRRPIITGKGASTKRSRGAGVHNLLERRRRGRINEKIRALRRLIPNCTKVDTASTVLEEAIEYLKTLQLQVQIMSMCCGLRMMTMMLTAGTQPIHPPHAGPFAPIGVNMGMPMGFGFGMGMLETAAGSTVVPPVPHMHRPLYHVGSIPGTAGLHGMPGSTNLPMFAMGVPAGGQALAVSMPMPPHPASSLTPSMGVSARREVNLTPAAAGGVTSDQAMDSAPPNSKDQQSQTTSRQANKECSDGHPSLAPTRNQPPNIGWQQSP